MLKTPERQKHIYASTSTLRCSKWYSKKHAPRELGTRSGKPGTSLSQTTSLPVLFYDTGQPYLTGWDKIEYKNNLATPWSQSLYPLSGDIKSAKHKQIATTSLNLGAWHCPPDKPVDSHTSSHYHQYRDYATHSCYCTKIHIHIGHKVLGWMTRCGYALLMLAFYCMTFTCIISSWDTHQRCTHRAYRAVGTLMVLALYFYHAHRNFRFATWPEQVRLGYQVV